MARRKRKQDTALLIGAVLGIYLLVQFINNNLLCVAIVIAAVAIVIAAIATGRLVLSPRRNRRRLLEKTNEIIEQHAAQLAKRRAQLVRQDAYGKPIVDKWHAEIDYFITEHIRPSLTNNERSIFESARGEVFRLVMTCAEGLTQRTPVFTAFSGTMTPIEFEGFCAEQLRASRWDAQLTAASGDQGVDVIAEKDGVRVVLQCKLYSGAVGNSAIQEIVAGKAYERADHCAVVSNSRYTPAAERLASANGVFLLHYSDLSRLETLVRGNSGAFTVPSGGFGSQESLELVPATASLNAIGSLAPSVSSASQNSLELVPATPGPSLGIETVEQQIAFDAVERKPFWLKLAVGITVAVVTISTVRFVMENQYRSAKANENKQPVAIPLTTSTNSRFGYRIEHPSSFVTSTSPDNGDGITLTSPDGEASLVVAGGNNDDARSTKDYYEDSLRTVTGKLGYRRLSDSWFVVTWINERHQVLYKKMFVGKGSQNSFTFTFPEDQRSTYEPVVTRIEKSFRPGAIGEAR